MHRTAGFGYGTKFDFTKLNKKTPAPNTYTLQSDFKEKSKVRGPTFGLSREALKNSGITMGLQKNVPGPGNYELKSTLSKLQFSMRPKTQDPSEKVTCLKNPGPGTYENYPSISKHGKYFYSKYRNSGATLFNPARSKRFGSTGGFQQPGPGHYRPKIEISKDGKYFLSSFHSSKVRTFSNQNRGSIYTMNIIDTPGPGSYRIPSEFGYYETANQHLQTNPNV